VATCVMPSHGDLTSARSNTRLGDPEPNSLDAIADCYEVCGHFGLVSTLFACSMAARRLQSIGVSASTRTRFAFPAPGAENEKITAGINVTSRVFLQSVSLFFLFF
jgi:hypothetical protein